MIQRETEMLWFDFRLLLSTCIGLPVALWLYGFHQPNLLYWVVFGSLLALFFITIEAKRPKQEMFFVLALTWLGGYWSVHDFLLGFYVPQTIVDNVVCLLPLSLVCFWIANPKAPAWWYAVLVIFDIVLTYFMNDTNNELMTILLMLALPNVLNQGHRTLVWGAIWYQGYLWSSKYMAGYFTPGTDYVYTIALTPYLITIIYLVQKRMGHDAR